MPKTRSELDRLRVDIRTWKNLREERKLTVASDTKVLDDALSYYARRINNSNRHFAKKILLRGI